MNVFQDYLETATYGTGVSVLLKRDATRVKTRVWVMCIVILSEKSGCTLSSS